MVSQITMIMLRALAVILIGFVSAVIGLILGAIVGGSLAGIFELVFGFAPVFNGREGYEGTGQIGFLLGALLGLVGSSVYFLKKWNKKSSS